MSADPRVEAVAEALWLHRDAEVFYADIWKNYGCECGWSSELDDADSLREHQSAAVMAALDAYTAREAGYPTMRDSDEADLRERIVREIDQAWQVRSDAEGHRHSSYVEGWLDGMEAAASIARGNA